MLRTKFFKARFIIKVSRGCRSSNAIEFLGAAAEVRHGGGREAVKNFIFINMSFLAINYFVTLKI